MQKITHSHGRTNIKGLPTFVTLASWKLCRFGSRNSLCGKSHKNPGCFGDKLKVLFSPTVTVELTQQNSTAYSVAKRTMKCGFTQGVRSPVLSSHSTPSSPLWHALLQGTSVGGCQQLPVCPLPVPCTHINAGTAKQDAPAPPPKCLFLGTRLDLFLQPRHSFLHNIWGLCTD